MDQASRIISSSPRRALLGMGAAAVLALALWGCGHRAGVSSGNDGAVPRDVEAMDVHLRLDASMCEETFETASCATDWSSCAPVQARALVHMGDYNRTGYLHVEKSQSGTIGRIGVVIRDRAAFEERWVACYQYDSDGDPPLPDLPEVDFESEMVIWHVQYYPTLAYPDQPEVWDCGACLVFVPWHLVTGAESLSWPITAVAVPTMDASVQFEDPVDVWPE